MPLRISTKLVSIFLFYALCTSVNAQSSADVVLINGKILTVDAEFSIEEAIAINGERILAVGDNESVSTMINDDTEVIDLAGATVIPGLIDNHFHFIRAVQRWHIQARLDGVNTRTEALQILTDKAASMKPGEWVMVQGGWYENQFADAPGGFTLEELDNVAPQNPLFLQLSYRTIFANSLALKAVGLSPKDGARHSAQGLATFQPPYGSLIQQITPTSPAQLEQNLSDFMHTLNKAGLTGLYALGRGPEGESSVLEQRARNSSLPLRIWHTLTYEARNPAGADAAAALVRRSKPNTFAEDFGLFGLGEHIYVPFFDFPNITESWAPDILANYMKIATAAAEGGWHIHEHTMSNISVRDLLDNYEVLNQTIPIINLRWTFAHVYDISPESIERAKVLGMTLAIHGVAMHSATKIPLRTIQDSGIIWGLGTDATIVSHYQPFITLGWVVSGLNLVGNRVLDQTVTREEALIAHTKSNAYLFSQEDELGSLEAGKLADLVVLDRDYMTIPEREIKDIQPVMTMVGGRVVYSK